MEENLGHDEQEKKIEDIAEQDWPYLRELESTRFALKNKKDNKRSRQSLQSVKMRTEKEDEVISEQNMEDEKLVDAFLSVKPNSDSNEIIDLMPQPEIIVSTLEVKEEEEVVTEVIPKAESPKLEKQVVTQIETMADVTPIVNNVTSQSIAPIPEPVKNIETQVDKEEKTELSKLIARGMAKTYISKTDTILNPLRFILSNSKQLGIALIQFIIPAIITWYLTTHVGTISNQLAKEAIHIHIIYTMIFYFACLFLWITSQVLWSGIWHLGKQTMANLVKIGKS